MSKILHISDTHFGTAFPDVVSALLRFAGEQRPNLLVLSGDVTQRSRRSQYREALRFLRSLPVPHRLVLPGNHDIPLFNLFGRLFFPYRNFRESFGDDIQPEFESRDLLVIGVNTTRPSRHTVGEVSLEQIERVRLRLSRATDLQLRVVVTHQPVRATRESDLKNLLRGHEYAVDAWSRGGADLILSGHVHLPHVRPLQEVFPHLPRRVWSVLAGTAVSRRVRGDIPNSVNLIRHEPGELRCFVERWDHYPRDGFVLAASSALHLQRP